MPLGITIQRREALIKTMPTQRYVYWPDGDMWLGFLAEYPDCWTQGETREELEESLTDIYSELTSGNIPCVRRVGELQVS